MGQCINSLHGTWAQKVPFLRESYTSGSFDAVADEEKREGTGSVWGEWTEGLLEYTMGWGAARGQVREGSPVGGEMVSCYRDF